MINVPDFEEVYRSMQPEDQEFSAGLLKLDLPHFFESSIDSTPINTG